MDDAHYTPEELSTRASLATFVMDTAATLSAAVTNHGEASYLVWKRALKDADDSIVTESVILFRKQLTRLKAQVEAIAIFGPDSKAFPIETIDGLHHATQFPNLMGSWANSADYFQGEKIGRLRMVRDILAQAAPAGKPTEQGLESLRAKLGELYTILERSDELPAAVRAHLRERLDALQSAIDRANFFGSEVVMAAAAQLAGGVMLVLRAEGGRAPLSTPAEPLREFASKAGEIIDLAGRVSFLWDAGQFALEHVQDIPRLFQLLP